MITIDKAKEVFDANVDSWTSNRVEMSSEQDVRMQVIDRVLRDVLGWSDIEFKTEHHVKDGYIDYLLRHDSRARLVVEAKKASMDIVDTRAQKSAAYKLGGPALSSAKDGIQQGQDYCLKTGVQLCILTTGFQWVGFQAVRTDGLMPSEGKSFVFPTLASISDDFALFYDLFSREGVLERRYALRFAEEDGFRLTPKEPLVSIAPAQNIRLLQKSSLAHDLEGVFKSFFSTMAGDDDTEMLAKCFVETGESKDADTALTKITSRLVSHIEVLNTLRGEQLQKHLQDALESQQGEFVLIIGNKGAGKSTFIDRFFRLVLDQILRRKVLLIRINVGDSTGDLSTIHRWLLERLKEEIENALYGATTPPTYDELQGIFYRQYSRWRDGEFKHLYDSDKTAFKIKFGEFVHETIEKSPDGYVKGMLWHAIRSRKLMPCLVFDNTDHFSQKFQEEVFQFAQSIHRAVLSFVICPITDRTIWQLSKHGPFQSYVTTSFYLPVPSTKEILGRRVLFIKDKLALAKSTSSGEYFLKKGIRLRIEDLNAFAGCVEEVFINTEYLTRIIGGLSNHDIRRTLEVTQRIILAPAISIDSLVKTYVAGSNFSIKPREIMRALIDGDYNGFVQQDNPFVLNLFAVDENAPSSPLLKLSLLKMLSEVAQASRNAETVYCCMDVVHAYFESASVNRGAVSRYMSELLAYRLVEPYDPTDEAVYPEQRVRITASGRIHYELATNDETYLSHVGLSTKVRVSQSVDQLRSVLNGGKLSYQDWMSIIKLFVKHILDEDASLVSLPKTDSYLGQSRLRQELKNRWVGAAPE